MKNSTLNKPKSLNKVTFLCQFIIVLTVVIITSSCNDDFDNHFNHDQIEQEIASFNSSEYGPKDIVAAKLAKNLAAAMQINEVREFIKKETSGKDDGLNATIYQFSKDKQISYTNKQNQRVIKTFEDIIADPFSENTNQRSSQSGFLDSVRLLYPTLHVAIPDHEGLSASDWDGITPLKVVYFPDKFAYEIESLQGYDSEGNIFHIDPIEEPDELLIFVGPNYKVTAIPHDEVSTYGENNSRLMRCPVLEQPLLVDEYYNYYDSQELSICLDPGSGGGTGGGNPGGGGTGGGGDDDPPFNDPTECITKAHRWVNNDKEFLIRFKYRNIDQFREINGNGGDPKPIHLDVLYGSLSSNNSTSVKKVYYYTRSQLRKFNLFGGSKTRWVNPHSELLTWNYMDQGDTYKYVWLAEGTGDKKERTFGLSTKFKAKLLSFLEFDRTLSFQHKVTTTDNNRLLGEAIVEYCDESATRKSYNTGTFIEFEIQQGKP